MPKKNRSQVAVRIPPTAYELLEEHRDRINCTRSGVFDRALQEWFLFRETRSEHEWSIHNAPRIGELTRVQIDEEDKDRLTQIAEEHNCALNDMYWTVIAHYIKMHKLWENQRRDRETPSVIKVYLPEDKAEIFNHWLEQGWANNTAMWERALEEWIQRRMRHDGPYLNYRLKPSRSAYEEGGYEGFHATCAPTLHSTGKHFAEQDGMQMGVVYYNAMMEFLERHPVEEGEEPSQEALEASEGS